MTFLYWLGKQIALLAQGAGQQRAKDGFTAIDARHSY